MWRWGKGLRETIAAHGGVVESVKDVFAGLFVIRGAVFAGLFGAVALSLPDQTIEIYRILALDRSASEGLGRMLAAYAALFVASATLWYVARRATEKCTNLDTDGDRIAERTLRWVPRLLTLLLPAAVSVGLFFGIREEGGAATLEAIDLQALDRTLLAEIGLSILCGVVLFIFTIARHQIPALRPRVPDAAKPPGRKRLDRRGLFDWKMDLVLLATAIAIVAACVILPVRVAQQIGTLPPFLMFVALLTVGLSGLFAFDDRKNMPVTWMLVGLFALFSYKDWGAKNLLTTMERTADIPMVDTAFRRWYEARVDKDDFASRDEPYPVFIVAAPGGGVYSAQFTATVLARLQDLCPRFAHHTFAISGVSGGSLGAAVFSSLVHDLSPQTVENARCDLSLAPQPMRTFAPGAGRTHERSVLEFMARDFMAPISTAALFLDLPQRAIPYPLPFLPNRADALERAFEMAWDDVSAPRHPMAAKDNRLAAPFLSHWDPKGSAPALMLNATEASRGHRVVIAPFELGLRQSDVMLMRRLLSFHKELADAEGGPRDISLSTAVGISARFPWVLPAAPVGKLRLLDGAIFENSGIETAMDLIAELKRYDVDFGREEGAGRPLGAPRIRITLIVIHNFDDYQPGGGRVPAWFSAPIHALLNAREARSSFALARADDALCQERGGSCIMSAEPHRARAGRALMSLYLDHVETPLTLGWHLSSATRALIERQSSSPAACRADDKPPTPRKSTPGAEPVAVHNGCSACYIIARLAPDPAEALRRCGQGETPIESPIETGSTGLRAAQ